MSDERYEIRGKIGQGGVGSVYRAYDTQLRREVAIKRVLSSEDGEGGYANTEIATKNLLKEATALSSVQHPHICTVYDAGVDKEGPYVVMELISGKTLDEMVERGTLTYDDFREVAIQSQEAMIAAQDLDLVHRDLKPSNVMVCWLPSGRFQVKLVDFGLAKFSAKPSLQTIDHGDAVFGSIFFMAPEQFERTPLDRRTDMYSLGCMYYYSLAGTYPFNGDSAPQVMASHLQNSVQPLSELRPDLPKWVCEWVMWHLERNMNDRPESARVSLEKYLSDEALAAQASGAGVPTISGPQAVMPATAPYAVHPATSLVNTQTAPQSIVPPGTGRVSTAAQPIRPAMVTGGTAIQPIRLQVTPNANIQPDGNITANNPTQPGSPVVPTLNANIPDPDNDSRRKKQRVLTYLLLGGAILGLGAWSLNKIADNKDIKEFNSLVKQASDLKAKDLETTEKQFNILLESLNDDTLKNRAAVFRRLLISKSDGSYSPDALIWKQTLSTPATSLDKETLAKLLSKRGHKETISKMVDYAVKHPNQAVAGIALSASKDVSDESDFPKFISILGATTDSQVRTAAESALQSVISSSRSKKALSEQLIGASKASLDKNYKLSMIRLLGVTGTKEAQDKLFDHLTKGDSQERIAAAIAFSEWPSDEPLGELIDAYADEENSAAKSIMFKSAVELLSSKRPHNKSELRTNWLQLAGYASTNSQKSKIISKAVQAKASWSLPVLKYFNSSSQDKTIREFAKRGISKISK